MPSILVVDDSAVDRKLVGGLLSELPDCTVLEAADGKEALALIHTSLPDLILTDLQMPEMDGLELMTAIKDELPFLPVILMTAHGSEDIAAQALRVGAASYVPKSNVVQHLLATVQRVLVAAGENRIQARLMHHLEKTELQFALPGDLVLINQLVDFAQQLLRCTDLGDETERLRAGVALEQALSNAYYHGNLELPAAADKQEQKVNEALAQQRLLEEPYRDRRIYVQMKIGRNEATFVVRDEGPGFDPPQYGALSDPNHRNRPAGRGLVLMHTIMDEVIYNETGNQVTLTKRSRTEESEPLEDDLSP